MKKLAILGAGGHGRVVAEAAEESGWTVPGLFDRAGPKVHDPWRVLGDEKDLLGRLGEFDGVIVAIGENRQRLDWTLKLGAYGGQLATVVHPAAWVSPRAHLGQGSVVLAGAIVGTGVHLGRAVIVNTGASVDHDDRIGDGVHIAPGARLAGHVTVGDRSWIGLGAVVRQGLSLGADVLVGAGAAVVKSVESGQTVVGVPAGPMSGPAPC